MLMSRVDLEMDEKLLRFEFRCCFQQRFERKQEIYRS